MASTQSETPGSEVVDRYIQHARWLLAGLVAGVAGLGASYVSGAGLTLGRSPVVAVADTIVAMLPGPVVRWGIDTFSTHDKGLLVGAIVGVLILAFAVLGVMAQRGYWRADLGYLLLAVLGASAVATRVGFRMVDLLPIALGLVTWLFAIRWLTGPIRVPQHPAARVFTRRLVLASVFAAACGAAGRHLGRVRRHVDDVRKLVRLPGLTPPRVRPAYEIGVPEIAPWQTPNEDFYLIHTAIVVPAIDPDAWSLRIHGMVERELVLDYRQLARRELTEQWITLNCVSNEVGGGLVGNAWWSGVSLAGLLAEAGAHPEADAVLQTSHDGWTCGTPLATLQDGRSAMIALAMNGVPLPIEHGFPARTIVPGLYGYVSACKWVIDIEVTRFENFSAYWTDKGWAERAPVKIASRIDVPQSGATVPAGEVVLGGVAWHQHVGIEAVQVSVDGGIWVDADLARTPSIDTWVQWRAQVTCRPGEHVARVRARGRDGVWQTPVRRDVAPDGATGWHSVEFSAR